jgi:hypothetical protein
MVLSQVIGAKVTKMKNGCHFYKLLLVLLLCVTMDNFLYNFISGTGLQINFFELVLTASILPGIYSLVLSLPILFFRERLAI